MHIKCFKTTRISTSSAAQIFGKHMRPNGKNAIGVYVHGNRIPMCMGIGFLKWNARKFCSYVLASSARSFCCKLEKCKVFVGVCVREFL